MADCTPPPLGTPQLDPLCNLDTAINSKFAEWQETVEKWFADALATMMRATATAWTNITTPGITAGDPRGGAPSSTVASLVNLTAYVSAAVVLLGIIWAMGRMAITQDPEPGKEAGKGFVRWVIVTGASAAVIGTGVVIADGMSDWIITQATGADFGAGLLQMVKDTAGLGFILLIVMALLGLLASVGQIILLVWRGGALIVMAGVCGVAAAAATHEQGKVWWQRVCGWILAYLLYKPVAALFYAAAFKLATVSDHAYDDTKTIEHITGFALIFLALLALPAMLRLVTPLVAMVSGGGGMGKVLAGAASIALPTGAMMVAGKGAAGAASAAASGGGGNSGGGGGEASGAASTGGGGGGGGGGGSAPAPSSGGEQQLTFIGGAGGASAPEAKNAPGGSVAAAFRGGTNPNAKPPTAKAV